MPELPIIQLGEADLSTLGPWRSRVFRLPRPSFCQLQIAEFTRRFLGGRGRSGVEPSVLIREAWLVDLDRSFAIGGAERSLC